MFTLTKFRVPVRVVLLVGLKSESCPVAAKVAGFPLIPEPLTLAVRVLEPIEPSTQLPTAATPSAPVTGVAPVTVPDPLATTKVTDTPETGAPLALVTRTEGATGTGWPGSAD